MSETRNTRNIRAARDQLIELANDYDRAVAEFRWPEIGPTFNWATEWFDVIARGNDRPALWIVEEDGSEAVYSFAELSERSDRVAAWLAGRGVKQGDRVMVMLGNQVELWESVLALSKLGAVIVPGATALGPSELVDRIARGRIVHVLTNASDAGKFDGVDGSYTRIAIGAGDGAIPEGWADYRDALAGTAAATSAPADFERAEPASGDPLLVYFTSGTTSKPKMVEHTQTSYPVGHLSTMYWVGMRPGDVHLAISSPGWAKHAWSLIFAPWIAEATVFVYNYARFDAVKLVAELDRAGVTTFCAPPTVWRMLIQAPDARKPRALREALSAGEPLNPEVISRIESRWGLTIRDGYGQTEMTASVANTPGSPVKPGSMGRPLPGVPVVLVDPVSGELADEGELCLDLAQHPFTLMTRYLDDPERNEEVTLGGYYHTGDVASRDDKGNITYIGRTDDVFKSSDYKVSPFEVESLLIEHPAVVEAAVVPAPHATRLTTPKAYIVLADGWLPDADTARALFVHAASTMPSYMRVRRIEFAELPKTISGKIRRVDLRQLEDEADRAGERRPGEFREEDFAGLLDGVTRR
ncbi:AMP-dependent synthetase [Subtercola boreus]|uniref:AMP-dependent synthetase n=1 Tax=Subtercola boreus TaxID=120213 RepID=A0A3E0VL34_9MICO|nr:AMP-binding protein [Subtercola boreus]RFA10198.1 AMP-dependent synthetase [Subtercola boreus]TQL52634.1 acetyl-CoA synthetase [Subtercola boreus]